MSSVWVAGADGAIGSACCEQLSASHHIIGMTREDADVRWPEQIENFIGDENPDALVYAVGVNHLAWSYDIDGYAMRNVYDINVIGLVRCLQAAATLERVVVIGSDAAHRPMRTSIAYNASKAALEAAVKVIARERAKEGFVINVVSPGLVSPSTMTDYVYERTQKLRPGLNLDEYMLTQIPMGRAGWLEEIAMTVKWLVEEAPMYLNGTVIEVNGAR